MPNHQIPIEDAGPWDILDWNRVTALASEDTGDPRDCRARNLWPWLAKRMVDAGCESDADANAALHGIASPCIGYGSDAVRRTKAGIIAEKFGADPERLIDYLAFKFNLFRRARR